jgi:hypothetical protein
VVDPVLAMIDGSAKVSIGLGGNCVAVVPDRAIAEAVMPRCAGSWQFLPSSTAVTSCMASGR